MGFTLTDVFLTILLMSPWVLGILRVCEGLVMQQCRWDFPKIRVPYFGVLRIVGSYS